MRILEKIYMSASPHKREDLTASLAPYGQQVRFAIPPQFAPEPDKFSPLVAPLKTIKFANHPEVQRQIEELEVGDMYWAFAMDINAIVPGNSAVNKGPELLTTCRGEKPSIVKVAETAQAIFDRRMGDEGHIVFDNLCAPVKIDKGQVVDWRGFLDRGRLSLSIPLIRLMADMTIWRKVIEASENDGLSSRSLDNAASTAGMDWTVLADKLKTIHTTTGVRNLRILWRNDKGRQWEASEAGVDRGMGAVMTKHLRGFTPSTVRGIAQLPQ